MKVFKLILTAVLALALPGCTGISGGSGFLLTYSPDGVEAQNFAPVPPGAEATTATGAGYNLTTKTAYVVYADGHRSAFKITGGGIGSSVIALVLEDGTRLQINFRTGAVTSSRPFGPPVLPQK